MGLAKLVKISRMLMTHRELVLLKLAQQKLKSFRLTEHARHVTYIPTLTIDRDNVSQKHAKSKPKFFKLTELVRVVKTILMQMTSRELAFQTLA